MIGFSYHEYFITAVPSVDTKTEGDNLFLDYEDYLVGLLEMASDLSRLTRNIITFGMFQPPI